MNTFAMWRLALLVASTFGGALGICKLSPLEPPDFNCTTSWAKGGMQDAWAQCFHQCLKKGYDMLEFHATPGRGQTCEVQLPGEQLYAKSCNVYGMALECHTKQWYVFPNACGSVVEEFGEPPEGTEFNKFYVAYYSFAKPMGGDKAEKTIETRMVAGDKICSAKYEVATGECLGLESGAASVEGGGVPPPMPPDPPGTHMPVPFPKLDENGQTVTERSSSTTSTADGSVATTTATTTAAAGPPAPQHGFFDHRVMTTAGAVVVIGALAFGGICLQRRGQGQEQRRFRDSHEIEVGYMNQR